MCELRIAFECVQLPDVSLLVAHISKLNTDPVRITHVYLIVIL